MQDEWQCQHIKCSYSPELRYCHVVLTGWNFFFFFFFRISDMKYSRQGEGCWRGTVFPFMVMLNKESIEKYLWAMLLTNDEREWNICLELSQQPMMVKETAGTTS